MATKNEKKAARKLQKYTGAHYTTCLRWFRTLQEEGLVQAERDAGTTNFDAAVRVALHKRFPDIEIERDELD
jgi:DNA-binding transcriptional regulator YhcF (GntR family)